MAITTKKDWSSSSIPTAGDFNRIENNISEINATVDKLTTTTRSLENNKEPKISILPVGKGGTGVTSLSSIRAVLQIQQVNLTCRCTKLDKNFTKISGDQTDINLSFAGMKISEHKIYSGVIKMSLNQDEWIKISVNNEILGATATAYRSKLNGYGPSCVVHIVSENEHALYAGCDQNSCEGVVVTFMTK